MRSNVGKCDTIGVSRRYGEMPYSILQSHCSARPPYRLDNEMAWTGGVFDSRWPMTTEEERKKARERMRKHRSNPIVREADRLRSALYDLFHKNEKREYGKKYRAQNREKIDSYPSRQPKRKRVYLVNEKKCRKCGTTKPLENFSISRQKKDGRHSYCKECVQRWGQENKERLSANAMRWSKANPDRVKAIQQNRRTGGVVTAEEWRAIRELYGNKCLCCGNSARLTMDHIIPLAKGGKHSADNIQPLCHSCNCKKHTKTIDYRERILS